MVTLTNQFTPLAQVTNPTVPTDAAAYYLNRKSQTLRQWACLENGAKVWRLTMIRFTYCIMNLNLKLTLCGSLNKL